MRKLIAFALIAVPFIACEKKDPVIPNEEELITTLIYTLSPVGGGADVVLSFTDTDGDGGNAPVIQTAPLAANTVYNGVLRLLNETETPADNITLEVEEEGAEHQFFYQLTGANATISYSDIDENGDPVGIQTELSTGAASNGQLTITLRHEPNKSAMGVKDGNLSNAGGETDIEVTFDVSIQ